MESTILIDQLGLPISLNVLLALVTSVVIVIGLCFLFTRHLSVDNPGKLQLTLEWLVDVMRGIIKDTMGDETTNTQVVIALTVFLFIGVSNLVGLPLLVDAHEISYWKSPTADLAVCLTLAVTMNLISQYLGIRKYGLATHFRLSYAKPAILLPYHVLEDLINIVTLSLRLYGNIFAGEILLKLIAELGNMAGVATWPIGIPIQIIWQGFSVFVGILQAYIFVNLSSVYMSHKLVHHD
ncbi:ATP synthase F0 subunit A [Dolosigranulum pigrum]|uniref:F0F1 ATP synthase subunit A n=1 Tax=Dolosigranulum pigrum TaxID=29394 RepID=UPI000DBF87D1|nr:F0F1 ATP synthase subunit A [Dolosigranulum pigrum]QTJ34086.1 F0F1 ATP synthase subunit A [Dolosigranulum pigrum]QTJ39260.1 F0F1 ATP synthase subunit A [Dolosigranulum pigrum]QTJ47751.1 F0F1 ATP synthase subunit A [Dolosigranulum pigrum]RAN52264.1 ATP synthase F0 subunit A [Dolosigranulum pigrum]RAN57442.1 ATP synthase F0 subunit A [Dolosigranulum pigrum]